MAFLKVYGPVTGDDTEPSVTSGTYSVVTSPVLVSGSYALRSNPTTTAVGRVHLPKHGANGNFTDYNVATTYWRVWFRVATLPATGEPFMSLVDTSNNVKIELRMNSTGNILAYDSTITLIATGSTTLTLNSWYRIEVKCGTGASAAYELKIDGNVEFTGSANVGGTNAGHVRLGKTTNRNGDSVDFYYASFCASDSAYPGFGFVRFLTPAGDGAGTDFTASAGSKYDCVNDWPHNSDTDYISDSTTGHAYTATCISCAQAGIFLISGSVNTVETIAAVRATVAFGVKVRLISGATTDDTTENTLGSSYVGRCKLYDTDPNTGAAWTTAALNAVEVGLVTGSGASVLRCTALGIAVDYNPGAFESWHQIMPLVQQAQRREAREVVAY